MTTSPNKIKYSYLCSLTDDFGVWQHAHGKHAAREHGYALDDSARALIVYLLLGDIERAHICLNYLEASYRDNQMVGFFDENRAVVSTPSSDDAYGLAMWALASAIHANFEVERASKLYKLLAESGLMHSDHIRPHVYSLIASTLVGDLATAQTYRDYLIDCYLPDVEWFEKSLRYANGLLPYALLVNYRADPIEVALEIATKSLIMIDNQQRIGAFPAPVGNRVWHTLGQITQDVYGQQPIDAASMVLAWSLLGQITGNDEHTAKAEYWMRWFYGHNIWQQPFADIKDGSCLDGLDEQGPNENYGAESTIMYLWAAFVLAN